MKIESVTEPPLVTIYRDEHQYEEYTKLINKRSVEYTGLEITDLISEISDELSVATGDTRDLQTLTDAYTGGEITRLARMISEEAVSDSYQDPDGELADELTSTLVSYIYYKILNLIEDDRVAITREVLHELPIRLELRSDLPT